MKCVPSLLSLSYMLSCLGLNLQFSTKHTTCEVHWYHINVIYNSCQKVVLPRNHWSFLRVANNQSHGSSTGRCSWNWGTGIDCTSACWSGRVQVSKRVSIIPGNIETSSASGPSKSSLSSSILAAGSSTILRSLTRSVTSFLSNYYTKWKGSSAGKMEQAGTHVDILPGPQFSMSDVWLPGVEALCKFGLFLWSQTSSYCRHLYDSVSRPGYWGR